MHARSLLPPFPIHEEPSGRRWRYRIPLNRAAFAFALTVAGFSLCVLGLATMSAAPGAAGLLCFLPGAYASWHYLQIFRGRVPTSSPDTYLEVEEVPDLPEIA